MKQNSLSLNQPHGVHQLFSFTCPHPQAPVTRLRQDLIRSFSSFRKWARAWECPGTLKREDVSEAVRSLSLAFELLRAGLRTPSACLHGPHRELGGLPLREAATESSLFAGSCGSGRIIFIKYYTCEPLIAFSRRKTTTKHLHQRMYLLHNLINA